MNACAFCGHDAAFSGGCLGPLLGPVATDQQTGKEYHVHRLCAVWSPEVYQTVEGTLRCVTAALRRGRTIKCDTSVSMHITALLHVAMAQHQARL